MTSDDIKAVQIIATTKDGKHIIAVSDEKPLIRHIVSCCNVAKLKDELFKQCALKEIMEEQIMQLERDEYKIQDDGIWISKKALEECKQHYCKVADKFSPKPKKQDLDFRYSFYLGKADVYVDLLKHFESLEL